MHRFSPRGLQVHRAMHLRHSKSISEAGFIRVNVNLEPGASLDDS
jgi:hypothetical protein